jgi:hypothetical protein
MSIEDVLKWHDAEKAIQYLNERNLKIKWEPRNRLSFLLSPCCPPHPELSRFKVLKYFFSTLLTNYS